jgi:hypothetical protein
MRPHQCIEHLQSLKAALGDETYEQLVTQLTEAGDSVLDIIGTGNAREYVFIPAPHAAAIVLRQFQQDFPDNPIADRSLLEQLNTVYSLIACENVVTFYDADVTFASELKVEHTVANFSRYPIGLVSCK